MRELRCSQIFRILATPGNQSGVGTSLRVLGFHLCATAALGVGLSFSRSFLYFNLAAARRILAVILLPGSHGHWTPSRADIVVGASVFWKKRKSARNSDQEAVSRGVLVIALRRLSQT
jgi:hypothetical protein